MFKVFILMICNLKFFFIDYFGVFLGIGDLLKIFKGEIFKIGRIV